MVKQAIVIILFLVALIMQGAVTTTPVVILFLVLAYILSKRNSIFVYAFVSGIVLDVMLVRAMGATALFFLPMILLLSLYQRKFEINSLPFAICALLVCSYSYTLIFLHDNQLLQAILVTIIGSAIYWLVTKIIRREKKAVYY